MDGVSVKMNLAPGEQVRVCPYNKNHSVIVAKMGNHIVRCRNKYRSKMMSLGAHDEALAVAKCQFNPQHSGIPSKELIYHETFVCEDRRDNNEDLTEIRDIGDGWKDYAPPKETSEISSDCDEVDTEDWTKDPPHFFDPEQVLATTFTFALPSGKSKAEKMASRLIQKEKFFNCTRPSCFVVVNPMAAADPSTFGRTRTASISSRASSTCDTYEDCLDDLSMYSDDDDEVFFGDAQE